MCWKWRAFNESHFLAPQCPSANMAGLLGDDVSSWHEIRDTLVLDLHIIYRVVALVDTKVFHIQRTRRLSP
jgi:hypothetical protein